MTRRNKQHNTGHRGNEVGKLLAEIGKLQTNSQYRSRRGAFFIEGVRNFVQVADHQFNIETIVYSERLLTAPLARKLVRQLRRAGVPTVRVSPEQFRRFSQAGRASGVAAVVRQRWTGLDAADPTAGLCWIVLGYVRSAGNFGTLIRTSEAIGGAGFILLDKRVDPYAPATVRPSMGALFRQQFVRTTPDRLQAWRVEHGCHVVGASPDGTADFHHFAYPRTPLLFLGEERQGLTGDERAMCDALVRIPMVGEGDSLNVGVAGSLLMYEVYRHHH